MTERQFRQLALSLPEVTESAHMAHPDFRVGNKVFATLGYPDTAWAMVKLPPDEQDVFLASHPDMFVRVKGAWGDRGATNVSLRNAKVAIVREALAIAWRNTAPARVRAKYKVP